MSFRNLCFFARIKVALKQYFINTSPDHWNSPRSTKTMSSKWKSMSIMSFLSFCGISRKHAEKWRNTFSRIYCVYEFKWNQWPEIRHWRVMEGRALETHTSTPKTDISVIICLICLWNISLHYCLSNSRCQVGTLSALEITYWGGPWEEAQELVVTSSKWAVEFLCCFWEQQKAGEIHNKPQIKATWWIWIRMQARPWFGHLGGFISCRKAWNPFFRA